MKLTLHKSFAVLLLLCTFAAALVLCAAAATYGDLTYTVSNGEVTITDCSSSATTVTIPSEIDGCPVTSIGDYAFNNCTGLTSIIMPDSVTSIGEFAFHWCCRLTSIIIPNGVTKIRSYTFSDCNNLTGIGIPNSVTNIGSGAFSSCNSLTSITIPDSVTSIGGSAFSGCGSLTSITIPDSVTSIGDLAFLDTAWYKNQPDGIVYAGKVAYAYKGTMQNGTSITLREGTTSIAVSAFSGRTGLASITIPDSVTRIGGSAFRGCSSLTSIAIPDSVTSIGGDAFLDTAWFKNQPDGLVYAGKVAYKYKGTMPSGTSITLRDETRGIAGYAFNYCNNLTSIIIPDSVTDIGDSAFWGCVSLASITIPDDVTSIGYYTFKSCRSLASITIPDSVTSIMDYAFEGCRSLTSIIIPSCVASIGDYTFRDCGSLKNIMILNPQCDIYYNSYNIPSIATIYGFKGSTAEAYATKYNREFIALTPTSLTATASAATYSDGTATLRVTATPTFAGGLTVERYGVFFAPAKYADSYTVNGQVVSKEGALASGASFSADLTDIPESAYDVKIYAWAFVKMAGFKDLVVCPTDPISIHELVK